MTIVIGFVCGVLFGFVLAVLIFVDHGTAKGREQESNRKESA